MGADAHALIPSCARAITRTQVTDSDVEDDRADLLPRNPSQQLGAAHPLMRPVTPGSAQARKRAARRLADQRAPF